MRKGMPRGTLTIRGIAEQVEPVVTAIAVFMAPVRWLRLDEAFITASDILFAASLILLLAAGRLPQSPLRQLSPLWLSGIALLILGLTVSSIINGSAIRGLIVSVQYLVAYFVLAFVLLGQGRQRIHSLIKWFVAGMMFCETAGIVVYFTQWDPTNGRMLSGSERLMSFLEDPNANANMIALTFPFIFYLWVKRLVSSFAALLCIAVLGTAVILTSSVGGLLITCAGLAVLFAANMRLKTILRSFLAGGIVVIGLWASLGQDALPLTFQKRVATALTAGDVERAGTFSDRAVLMREALELIGRNPFIGIGADEFRRNTAMNAPVHNAYLIVWVEGGILALMGWLLLLSLTPLSAFLLFYATRLRQAASTSFATGVIIAMVALSTAHMYGRFWTVPMLLAIGLSLVTLEEARVRMHRVPERDL
jgi:O-antigen ligase